MPAPQDFESLTVNSGGLAELLAGTGMIRTRALAIGGTGKLDLVDNDLMFDYTGASQLDAVQGLINLARNGGDWLGAGLTSTAARIANPQNTTLGAMEATEFDSIYGSGALFNGVDPDSTAVLVKYTYYGDTDFSGSVDFDDYVRSDAGFNGGFNHWLNGDFDGSGVVDFDDYVLIDLAFNTQSGTL
jgi:hypothetical protein